MSVSAPYVPPGVSVRETISPSVSPLLGPSANVCIVGVAGTPGTQTQTALVATDVVLLSGTTPVVLPTIASLQNAQVVAVTSVINTLNPQPTGSYSGTTDYTVTLGEGPPNGTNGTIARVTGSTIASGSLVTVTYTYLPVDYWEPILLHDIGSVESRFGPSWTSPIQFQGSSYYTTVGSQLSMAARLAFANGAESVICQPLFQRSTPGDPTSAQQPPTASAVGQQQTWQDTLYSLRPISDINVVVPIAGQDGVNVTDSGMLNIFTAIQTHQAYMNTQNQPILAIFGEDGTVEGTGTVGNAGAATGLISTLRTHAASLQGNFANAISAQDVLINNTVFTMPTPGGLGTAIQVGGQYAAAAVAGALAARPASASLTRQPILGFTGVTDPRTPSDKNLDAAAGLFVVEQIRGNFIRCRQALTLDIKEGPARSELSVVRSKFLVIESIANTLDNQIIGNIIADSNSPIIVASAISSVLSLLQQAGAIVGYSQVQAALTNLNPTTITASFSYQPAFPLNFVSVVFSLDLTNNAVTSTTGPGANG